LIWSAVLHPPWVEVVLQEYAHTMLLYPFGLDNVLGGRKFTEVIPDGELMVVVVGELEQ
jgi:hypothetical protein